MEKKKMFTFNKITIVHKITFFIALFYGFTSSDAFALGQKPSERALAYVHNIDEVQKYDPDTPIQKASFRLLAKCSEPYITSVPVGVLLIEDGKVLGYKSTQSIQKFETKNPLYTQKERVDQVFAYANKINLEKIEFKMVQENATYCGIDYFFNDKLHSTKWTKHPYLRQDNPPPSELITLFEAINNIALDKDPFPQQTDRITLE